MKYYEVKFGIVPVNDDARDVLAAMAGEAGFETFEESEEGLTGYVQQELFDEDTLMSVIEDFPFEGTTVSYEVCEAEDKDWNEQWEQEGFEPIVVDNQMIIHDGRHLPTPSNTSVVSIEIDAKLAFGTGTHETTRMVCATLLSLFKSQSSGIRRVLDCGCGTGILGIAAMKLGASECVGYDIDEWSVDNTRHNAVINHVEVTPLHGDASVLEKVEGTFDLVMANINRNILLQDMPKFRSKMAPGAHLVLSGFYTDDIPLLTKEAASLNLSLSAQKEENGWACILLEQSV